MYHENRAGKIVYAVLTHVFLNGYLVGVARNYAFKRGVLAERSLAYRHVLEQGYYQIFQPLVAIAFHAAKIISSASAKTSVTDRFVRFARAHHGQFFIRLILYEFYDFQNLVIHKIP